MGMSDQSAISKNLDRALASHATSAETQTADKDQRPSIIFGIAKIVATQHDLETMLLNLLSCLIEAFEAAEAADRNLDLRYTKGLLALTAKSVAVQAGAHTQAKGGQKVQQAQGLIAQGDRLLAGHDYVGAADKYQQTMRESQGVRYLNWLFFRAGDDAYPTYLPVIMKNAAAAPVGTEPPQSLPIGGTLWMTGTPAFSRSLTLLTPTPTASVTPSPIPTPTAAGP